MVFDKRLHVIHAAFASPVSRNRPKWLEKAMHISLILPWERSGFKNASPFPLSIRQFSRFKAMQYLIFDAAQLPC